MDIGKRRNVEQYFHSCVVFIYKTDRDTESLNSALALIHRVVDMESRVLYRDFIK